MKQKIIRSKTYAAVTLFFSVVFLWSVCSTSFAQVGQPIFSKLSVEDGLSSPTVTSIIKDSRGYMWFGTKDGLNQFNGYDFKVYRTEPDNENSLVRNWILAIFEDSEGTVWVSTFGGGLHYYNRVKDHFVRVKTFANPTVNKMIEDDQHRIWFAGNTLLSMELNDKSWVDHSDQIPNIFNSAVNSFIQTSEDEFWVGTDACFYRWNASSGALSKFAHEPSNPNSLGSTHLNTIIRDTHGNLWIGTRGAGLDKYEISSGTFKHYNGFKNADQGPLVNVIRTLWMDGDFLWIGTENGGLSKLDTRTNEFIHYYRERSYPNGLSDNSIWSLYKDNEGRLWIGTFSFGINLLDPYQNKFSILKLSADNTVVNSIFRDSQKRLWIGTEGGVIKVENNRHTQYLNESSYKSKNGIPVLSIYEDNTGQIWLGTWADGIYRYDQKADTFISIAKEGPGKFDLSDGNNYSIIHSTQWNETLIASYQGLNIMPHDFNRDGFIKVIDSIGNYIRVLFEDSNGNIWVGSHTEMKLYNGSKHTLIPIFYHDKPGKNSLRAATSCMHEDSKGRLWVGTDDGLYVIEQFAIARHYTTIDGIANQDIRGIQSDRKGNIWFCTNTGISMLNPVTNTIKNYDASDGIFSNGFKGNSSFCGPDGLIYFGGSDGIIVFDPMKIDHNPFSPRVVLTDIKLSNRSLKIDGADSILHRHVSETNSIALKHNASMITFDFVALSYSASQKNQYAYKLVGFDQDWNYVGKARSATYTNLPPGEYRFVVKSSNNDGVWGEESETIVVTVLPAWWNTLAAYVVYFILFLVVLYFFRRVILMRAQFADGIRVERLKLENSEKLSQAKLNFFTNISHEFRTPLTIIMGLIDNISSSKSVDHIIKSKLHAANINASRLLRLVNELMDFRKAETGNMKLKVVECNIVSFVREIKLSFEPLAEEKQISFSFHAPAETINVWIDTEQFEKVMYNLLSNSFKSTPHKGSVSILIRNHGDNIVIGVQDNGKGIQPEFIENIFETFFSAHDGNRVSGTGIGLALTKSIVELHHGRIDVDSIQNTMTRFNITLLPGKAHFNANHLGVPDSHRESPIIIESENFLLVPSETTDTNPSDKKILLVEDNEDVLCLLQTIFEPLYTVLQARDGVSGWTVAIQEVPDLIISDVMMPNKDGIALCKELKSNIETSHIPVVLLTARASLVYQMEGLETGADDYVTKPFDPKLLILKVRNLIQSRERIRNAFHDHTILKIEPHEIAVTRRDQLFIENILHIVEKNISNVEYGVENLSMDIGMSKTTLFRKMKAVTGQSANEFIRIIRLKRAAQLLHQHELTVSEIAYMVGFNDVKYFRLCFKKLFKVSPSEYSNREELADLNERPLN